MISKKLKAPIVETVEARLKELETKLETNTKLKEIEAKINADSELKESLTNIEEQVKEKVKEKFFSEKTILISKWVAFILGLLDLIFLHFKK